MKPLIISLGILIPIFLVNFLVFLFAWIAPTDPPPGGNPSGFLNTGATAQFKEGALGIGGVLEALGLKLNPNDVSVPTCDASNRGVVWVKKGGTGVGDEVVTCVRDGNGDYRWKSEFVVTEYLCGDNFTDPRDSNVYGTVQIGTQCWMKKNMAYLPSVVGPATGSTTVPYYYVYDYNGTDVPTAKAAANYTNYGVLYNWPAARSACPEGWRLPSDGDWKTLEMHLGMTGLEAEKISAWRGTTEGKQLKSVRTATGTACAGATHTDTHPRWNHHASNCGSNTSGFDALPGGFRGTGGAFGSLGTGAHFWSSSPSSGNALRRTLNSTEARVYRNARDQANGFSVRCLRD
jgi:uncharacterized protein (TIGR02145 family)